MNRGRTAPWAYRNNKAGGLSAPASLERKEWRRHVQAPCVEVQDQPPPRGQSLGPPQEPGQQARVRSEEHTSELQSLMRISYAVFCLKKKNKPRKSRIQTNA